MGCSSFPVGFLCFTGRYTWNYREGRAGFAVYILAGGYLPFFNLPNISFE